MVSVLPRMFIMNCMMYLDFCVCATCKVDYVGLVNKIFNISIACLYLFYGNRIK